MNTLLKKIIWPVMAVPAIFLALVWKKLPEKIALHFDLAGNADRFGSKNELVTATLILTAMNILVYLAMTNIYRIDPKKYAVENKNRLQLMGFAVAVFMAAITGMIIYTAFKGSSRFDIKLILAGVGFLFAFMGNYMLNIKPNYFVGFRLPWTLENAGNWKKTHAVAGRLWFAGGLFLAIICLFLPTVIAMIFFFTVMTIIVIIPCVYSYRMYKNQKISGT